jgi:adenine-specific DNA-methyltransferase
MDKLNMQTTNIVDENIKRIGELFPNCLTERLDENGKPETAIDFDLLRQELSKSIVEGPEERYQFTWPDKRNAIRLANAPTTDTLRPCREESVDFDTTQNLYIEGDNLQVLKLLRENYLGKVKMIYIDPPYNTGNDFVYNDDFAQSAGEYIHNSGQEDEDGNHLVANPESNGRFHTDWLNMIYPRLKVAKDLLSDDGVIYISIDENEIRNLRCICDEIFGASNRMGTFIWRKKNGGGQAKEYFVVEHEYIVVYRKSECVLWKDKTIERDSSEYNKVDRNGSFKITKLAKWGNTARREDRPSMYFPIIAPDGIEVFPISPDGGDGRWRVGKNRMDEIIENDLIYWEKKQGSWVPYEKEYFEGQSKTIKERSILYEVANTGDGSNELTDLFGKKDNFENPKPSVLLRRFIEPVVDKGSLILDFFSGSATTAHAVMQLNAEDGGNRKFIMVQLPEATDEKSEAYKAGYKNICEIGKERIRRAGKKIVEEQKTKQADLFSGEQKPLDTGFRVLKLDSSNMQDVYYSPEQFNENLLFEDNIRPDRTEEDLLFQAMIELGIELSAKIEKQELAGKTVWSVANGYLMACFDTDVNETTITEIARQKPYYFVMRDSSLATDNVADNFEQIWEEYSKETIRRIL